MVYGNYVFLNIYNFERLSYRLWPTYASAHNNLGTLVNNFEVAERHFLSAIMYASSHVNAHFNLAQLYM